MTDPTTGKKKSMPGYPPKGHTDRSWPTCGNCNGNGAITEQLAIDGRGLKGDPCASCNGVGRVPDPAWPKCGCDQVSDDCVVCFGLGQFSPEVQASLADRLKAAQGAIDNAVARMRVLRTAAAPPRDPIAR
jgi:DnaJ-class molecular chaperone